ncbi:hypothetical protein [Halalkalicoccus jeotgali]|uniref:Uncharacterized protein n=1 Tax=Halalkalicoccus jeotgali (strain DSM 18796 / CECT 7217 / JCM 14584 / KCTC 4019 / B3) TaxID=795797 RepID=D8JBE8_HALJB|nr:hypothetical protein [Halalkalicoccus jeotgali]ADJ16601.1 hypothetical protein HacjB3_16216 [Halalkalicoccus jeotgali B3]ELY41302.1 hypothetical protein C497_01030 [Halalkalicoccus jeotgali B3]
MATEYVFISDLHMGGDEQLTTLDFEDELVSVLDDLRKRGGDIELTINADVFIRPAPTTIPERTVVDSEETI